LQMMKMFTYDDSIFEIKAKLPWQIKTTGNDHLTWKLAKRWA
jgi:hypothetical protein